MKLSEIMTPKVEIISPECTLQEAAQKMRSLDVGALPIHDGADRLAGMITDRDLVVHAIAEGADVKTRSVKDFMTSPIVYCFEDQSVEEAARIMEVKQIRRLVVLNRKKRLVGVVSLGDLVCKAGNGPLAGETLEKISISARSNSAA